MAPQLPSLNSSAMLVQRGVPAVDDSGIPPDRINVGDIANTLELKRTANIIGNRTIWSAQFATIVEYALLQAAARSLGHDARRASFDSPQCWVLTLGLRTKTWR